MNCVYTLNFDNLLCSNARQSFTHAAHRWNCAYFELTQVNPAAYGHFHKIIGIKEHLMRYDQVLYLDADTLIRADTPNPFELFTGNNVYGVRDAVDGWEPARLKMFREEVTDPWLLAAQDALGVELPIADCDKWFINSGMFLLRPQAVSKLIDLFIARMPAKRERPKWEQGKLEQALWNAVLHLGGVIEHIGREWNWIEPDVSTGKMLGYIYHFTGLNWQWLRQIQPVYDWRSVPA